MDLLHRPHLPKVGAEVFGSGITCAVAAILLLAITAIDKLSGWELRLQILYMLPAGLVTWSAGRWWGLATSAVSIGLWLVLFQHTHGYSQSFYYYWDAAVSLATLAIFVELLSRLHEEIDTSHDRLRRAIDLLDGRYKLKKMDGGREEKSDHAKRDAH